MQPIRLIPITNTDDRPSDDPMTTRPEAMAGDDISAPPSSYSQTTLPLARSSTYSRPSFEPTNTRPPAMAGDESMRARVM